MSAREKQVLQGWPHPPAHVFAALARAIEGGKYRVMSRNDDAHQVIFEKGSKWGWLHRFAAEVVTTDNGSRLELTVTSPPETIVGIANGLILQKAGQKVTKTVDAALSATSHG